MPRARREVAILHRETSNGFWQVARASRGVDAGNHGQDAHATRPLRGGDPALGNGDRPNPLRHDRCAMVLCDACITPKAFHNIAQLVTKRTVGLTARIGSLL